jgi:hypothetical protein
MAVGTMMWSVWYGMAMDGQITGNGPSDPAQRNAMEREDPQGGVQWQPYSVRFGNRWYSFERADPLGTGLSLVGDMAELMRDEDWTSANDEQGEEMVAHGIAALGEAFFDRVALRGAFEFTSAMTSGDTADAEQLIRQRVAGTIPGSSLLRTLRRADDQYLRETTDIVQSLRNTVPGESRGLSPKRDLWGRARRYTSEGPVDGVMSVLGIRTRAEGGNAIDLEILNQGVTVSMPPRSFSIGGERVSLKNRPDIYNEFVRLAGQPAFEHLNAIAEGRHPDSEAYFALTDGPDGGKAEFMRDVIGAYRDEARGQIMEIYGPEMEAMGVARLRRRAGARAGQ